jgi:hypothetical protein
MKRSDPSCLDWQLLLHKSTCIIKRSKTHSMSPSLMECISSVHYWSGYVCKRMPQGRTNDLSRPCNFVWWLVSYSGEFKLDRYDIQQCIWISTFLFGWKVFCNYDIHHVQSHAIMKSPSSRIFTERENYNTVINFYLQTEICRL